MRRVSSAFQLGCLVGAALLALASPALAEGITETPNTCVDGGQGLACDADQDCTDNALATVCVEAGADDSVTGRCQIPCGAVDENDTPDSSFCSAGETCTKTGDTYHCKPTKFTMDINLLDHCIQHFLNGIDPSITDSPTCSLESHLNRMLDQTGDLDFDIFDMDLCIKAFVNQDGCDPATESCERDVDTYCAAEPSPEELGIDCSDDADCSVGTACSEGKCVHGCGEGGYCDEGLNRCTRDCGTVFVRGIGTELTALDRQCFGRLTQCNYERGRCEPIELDNTYCEVDQECPSGAYCLMGECAPKCSSNLDCPGSDWYCAVNNHCRPVPLPPSEEGFVFEPTNYSVQFGTKVVELNEIQNEVEVPLLMMDLETRERVIDNPAVVFGYRMKVTYQLKGDSKCLKGPQDITCSELADCSIEPEYGEGFVTMEQPVGTIFATANPTLRFMLNQSATDILTTGSYSARVEMFLNNGARTSFLLTYSKRSLSGQYTGTIEPYLRDPDNGLGIHMMAMDLAMQPDATPEPDEEGPTYTECVDDIEGPDTPTYTPPENWNALLEAEGLGEEATMIDTFSGTWVQGTIDGNSSAIFDWPMAQNRTSNRIPVKGYFDQGLGQLRLIGIIDVPSGYCQGEEGACGADNASELKIDNLFERPVRRLFQFMGTYDLLNKRYSGIYREKVSGLSPNAFTLEGTFNLAQTSQDEVSELPVMADLATISSDAEGGEIAFTTAEDVEALLDADILAHCGADGASVEHDTAKNYFSSASSYVNYITNSVSNGISSEHTLPNDEVMTATCRSIPLGDNAQYVNKVHATISANTSAISNAWIYLKNGAGDTVGTVNFQPNNYGVASTGDTPVELDEVAWVEEITVCSWWNPATLTMLKLEYQDPTWGAGRVFLDGQTFNDRVASALVALGNEDTSTVVADASLTIQDFLQGQAGLCDEGGADKAMSCIDEGRVACGLALYRKAMLDQLFTIPTSSVAVNGDELFCETSDTRDNCRGSDPALIAYQEHNRFYQELSQAYSYSAQNELSDALFTVVRNAAGALESYNAFGYKETKLLNALEQYDRLRKLIYSPVSARVLHMWPMGVFKTRGRSWLDQMHTVSAQRLDALSDVVDLKRRLWANTDSQDFTFVQHLMHEEYLAQIFLMNLQKEWEGDQFTYLGEGAKILERGNDIIRQVDEARNPLGLPKNQVFFETNHVNTRNWKFYRKLIMDGPPTGGLLADTEHAIEMAMDNLKDALQSKQEFEASILEQRQQFTETLDQICGAPQPFSSDGCHKWSADEFKTAINCDSDSGCGSLTSEWKCPGTDENCGNPYATITDTVSGLSCSTEHPNYTIDFEQTCSTDSDCGEAGLVCQKSGSDVTGLCVRYCTQGDVGGLLMEIQALKFQRERIAGKVKRHMKMMNREYTLLKDNLSDSESRMIQTGIFNFAVMAADNAIVAIEAVKEASDKSLEGVGCVVIGGFAVGTNCPQKIGSATARAISGSALAAAKGVISAVKNVGQYAYDMSMLAQDLAKEKREAAVALRNMMGEMQGLLDEYAEVGYQINQVQSSVDDLLYLAEQARARYQENTAEIIDHLIGNQSGNVLHRNAYVQDASAYFDELMKTAYKMVMAMGHTYNLKGAPEPYNLDSLINRLYQMLTPGDVADFIAELDYLEATYCGQEGIDCDASSNGGIYRFSIRDQLFPQLRDLVDRHTGTVLTKGEQFHNIITSAPFLKRRTRAGVSTIVEQIEIPFGIWLYENDSSGLEDGWMLSPFECNHLVGHDYTEDSPALNEGVIAAYYSGQNVEGLKYELWRGHTDYIRGCRPETVTPPGGGVPYLDYPINVYTVGYAPQSLQAQDANAPTLVTHTSYLNACSFDATSGTPAELTQAHAGEHGCFNFFARDRSLSAPDWRLVIPIGYGSSNDWVMNDGVPEEDRAVIDDIVLYFRYRSRPLGDL